MKNVAAAEHRWSTDHQWRCTHDDRNEQRTVCCRAPKDRLVGATHHARTWHDTAAGNAHSPPWPRTTRTNIPPSPLSFHLHRKCQRREHPTVETRAVEDTSSQSDVSTAPDASLRTRPSREWRSETWLKPPPSETSPKPLSTTNTQSQRCSTSCTTVSPVPSTLESSESDPEPTERSELLLSDKDSTKTPRESLQPTLPRELKCFRLNFLRRDCISPSLTINSIYHHNIYISCWILDTDQSGLLLIHRVA